MTTETWPAEWLPARRRETAYHEAGHILAGSLLNLPAEHASIVRTDDTLGCVWHAREPIPDDLGRAGVSALEQPPALRDWAEREIVGYLAGPLAGLYAPSMGPVRSDDYDERAAEAIARRSDRIAELTAALAADPGLSDDEEAQILSRFLTDSPGLHLAWLHAETRDMLERHAAALEALADALYAAVEMNAAEIAAVIRAHPCKCHRPEVAP